MARIVLHIGTHKTGTTSIQDSFHANRALLKQHGVIFPRVGQTRGQHGLASAWINLPFPYRLLNAKRSWQRLARVYGPRDGTVFISSEELSRLRPRRVDMAQLRDWLAEFDEVKILCCLRNQASFLQSVYQQVSDERQPGHWVPYLQQALHSRMVDGLALNYAALLAHIETGFAPDEITLLSYDQTLSQPGGLLGAILRALDLPLSAEDLAPSPHGRSNISPPPLASFAANGIAQPGPASAGLVHLAARHLPDQKRSTVFSRPELAQVRALFDPLNQALEQARHPYQPGFRIGPMLGDTTPEQSLMFRGELAEDYWVELGRALQQAQSRHAVKG